MYGHINPSRCPLGGPKKVHSAARKALLEYHSQSPFMYLDELARYLEEEWDITVSISTVSRLLKDDRRSLKKGSRVGPQSSQLRVEWQAFRTDVTAEQLVFLDESLFKAQTGWRCMAYGLIGSNARWHDDMRRGDTWSILPALTVDGYIPCTHIQQGFINQDDFFQWFTQELLPNCNPFPNPKSVIIMDNLGVHQNRRIQRAVDEKGCLLKYLPPYSPDYNLIELTFNILKYWMRRHFCRRHLISEGTRREVVIVVLRRAEIFTPFGLNQLANRISELYLHTITEGLSFSSSGALLRR